MIETNDRRRFSRVHFNIPVEVTLDGKQWQPELVDISLKGLLVQGTLPKDWDSQQLLHVKIQLSNQAFIDMTVQLAHQETDRTGFTCVSIDMDSISHLRRLIELNLATPNAAERELAELIALC